jgi:hypothetical protein
MEIQFIVGGKVEYIRKTNLKKDEVLNKSSSLNSSKQKFKIPMNMSIININVY